MQAVQHLHAVFIRNGCSISAADRRVGALAAHACVCRARADAPVGSAFRAFVAYASRMTRKDKYLWALTQSSLYREEHAAACEALFDLIMEGV